MDHDSPLDQLLGRSAALARLRADVATIAPYDTRVQLYGPTGTGKTTVARAIHHASRRAPGRFVRINCPAIPDTLFVRELFGSERGAFTGADQPFEGGVAMAHGGTLFLEEVGDLSADNQAKLLGFLDDGRYRRLGGREERRADVRVVCATQQPLVGLAGFRQDLAQRLAVFPIRVPPLAERGDDVLMIARDRIAEFARRHRQRPLILSEDAATALLAHGWPGNVRELENVLERGLVRASHARSRTLRARHLFDGEGPAVPAGDFRERMNAYGRFLLEDALRKVDGNRTLAARALGLPRSTLYEHLARFGL